MNNKINAVLTCGFLTAILLILMAADLVTEDRLFSQNENRLLAEKPEFSLKAVLDGTYMEAYEEYVTDQFVARDSWIELKTRADILLQKKEINGVYLCEDDYLIECHKQEDITPELVEEKLTLLEQLVDRYDAKVMLVPTADNILSEKLPLWAEYYDQKAFLAQAEERIGKERLINVYDALKAHSEEEIYYRTDHHWTTLGAYYGYLEWKKATDSVALKVWKPDNLQTVTEDFLGTLHSRINLSWEADEIRIFPQTLELTPTITYDFTTVTHSFYEEKYLDTKDQYAYFLDGNHPFVTIETGYKRRGDLVLIKNSYANSMIPLLSAHYSNIYVVDLRYYNGKLDKLIGSYMAEDTDVLVLYDCIHFIKDFRYD